MRKKESFAVRVRRIARKLNERRLRCIKKHEERGEFKSKRPMRRKETPDKKKVERNLTRLIAYDLETTSIKPGTPHPLYLTACGKDFWFSGEILSQKHLCEVLCQRFLLDELSGCRFVAWNGNHFDVYLIALSLLKSPDYILRPYLTSSKSLRGLRVIRRQFDSDGNEITLQLKGKKSIYWEFLDGMAMTGITKSLKDFLKTFAPEYQKLEGPDFEHETFNPRNPDHVRYAERDSEGLYHALERARSIVLDNFSVDLSPTIGNMGIKIFQRFIPEGVEVWSPPVKALRAIRDQVMRGGFCFCVQRYRGPVWKYDLNQAYAAAMREARLPSGRCFWSEKPNPYSDCYIALVSAKNHKNRIPFYYRSLDKGASVFGLQEIENTWLTSLEIDQLRTEGWKVDIKECWSWESSFTMKEYVDRLEDLRIGKGRNPKDAQGEMVKMIGNNSYGKTLEELDGLELVMSAEAPDGFHSYMPESDVNQFIWFRFAEPMLREYHQPQIGAFITAHVRMVVRRAALLDPDSWLYADTDCVMFKQPQHEALDIDPGRYGAWKIEEEGTEFVIAAKKVYASADGSTKHAKGLNIRRLGVEDFERWLAGAPPEQLQVQRQNILQVLSGFPMFVEKVRVGERI